MIADGLYQVTGPTFCAGFVIEGGKLTMCAPILRSRMRYWMDRPGSIPKIYSLRWLGPP